LTTGAVGTDDPEIIAQQTFLSQQLSQKYWNGNSYYSTINDQIKAQDTMIFNTSSNRVIASQNASCVHSFTFIDKYANSYLGILESKEGYITSSSGGQTSKLKQWSDPIEGMQPPAKLSGSGETPDFGIYQRQFQPYGIRSQKPTPDNSNHRFRNP